MLSRRALLKRLSTLSLFGLFGSGAASMQSCDRAPGTTGERDIAGELGIRTFINAAGTYTSMTGCLMPGEVMQAINASSSDFMMLDEAQDKVGERIAEMCHAESAMVSAGCWSAMVLGTAGVIAGTDPEKAARLPHLDGTDLKSEVIVQKSHNSGYVHAVTNTGVTIVPVESREELENAISEDTAMMWFLNKAAPDGMIQHEEWVEIGRKHDVPTMIDIAADVPPVENLWKFNDMGFDLVCISGGKALRGPQSAGILMGREDLVAAARFNSPPRGGNIGRGMKVNKEEILGMYAAVKRYVEMDHEEQWKRWEDRIALIEDKARQVDGVTTEVTVPPIANHTPSLAITWDKNTISLSQVELRENLREGDPSIEMRGSGENTINLTVFMLQPGEAEIVGERIREELSRA